MEEGRIGLKMFEDKVEAIKRNGRYHLAVLKKVDMLQVKFALCSDSWYVGDRYKTIDIDKITCRKCMRVLKKMQEECEDNC